MIIDIPLIMKAIDMPLHPGQLEVFTNLGRFNIILNGRRWGKSLLAAVIILSIVIRYNRARIWLVAPQHLQNKEVMHYLDEILCRLGEPHKYTQMPEHKMTIGKAIVECRSGDNPSSMRGAGLDAVLCDEVCYIRGIEALWSFCLRPALADRQGSAYFMSSPNGQDWPSTLLQSPNWKAFQQSTYRNPYIPVSEIDAMKDDMPDMVFRSEIMAEIVKEFGLAFPHQPLIVEHLPEGPRKTGMGVDWGWADQYAAILLAKCLDGKTYGIGEIYAQGLTPREQAIATLAMGIPPGTRILSDASTHIEAGRESIANQWRAAGLSSQPATRDRMGTLQLLRMMLRDDLFRLLKGACPNLEAELKAAKVSPRNAEDITGLDHAIDATRYGLAGIHLMKPEREPEYMSPAYTAMMAKLVKGSRGIL